MVGNFFLNFSQIDLPFCRRVHGLLSLLSKLCPSALPGFALVLRRTDDGVFNRISAKAETEL